MRRRFGSSGMLQVLLLALGLVTARGAAAVPSGPVVLEDGSSYVVAAPGLVTGLGFWGFGEFSLPEDIEGAFTLLDQTRVLFQTWGLEVNGELAPLEAYDSSPLVQVTDTNGFGGAGDTRLDTLSLSYVINNHLQVDVTATLRGGPPGSGQADLAETIRITNICTQVFQGGFVQAVLPWLGPDSTTDSNGPNQVSVTGEFGFFEEVISPGYDDGGPGFPEELVPAIVGDFLPMDALEELLALGFALRWDLNLAPGESFVLSKDKRLDVSLPEPGTLALLGLGLPALVVLRRRRAA